MERWARTVPGSGQLRVGSSGQDGRGGSGAGIRARGGARSRGSAPQAGPARSAAWRKPRRARLIESPSGADHAPPSGWRLASAPSPPKPNGDQGELGGLRGQACGEHLESLPTEAKKLWGGQGVSGRLPPSLVPELPAAPNRQGLQPRSPSRSRSRSLSGSRSRSGSGFGIGSLSGFSSGSCSQGYTWPLQRKLSLSLFEPNVCFFCSVAGMVNFLRGREGARERTLLSFW